MYTQGGSMIIKRTEKEKRMITILLLPFLVVALICQVVTQDVSTKVYACATVAECQNEIAEAQKKREQLKQEQKNLEDKSAALEDQIQNIIKQIESFSIEITVVNIQLTDLEAQHKQLVESITEKDRIIKTRMIETQLSYETNETLDFIANSSSITDMIERAQAVDTITEADQNMIRILEGQKQEVVKNEEIQKQRREQLESLVTEQQALQKSKEAELAAYLAAVAAAQEAQKEALRDEQLSQSQLAAIERAKQSAPTIASGTALQNEKAAFAYFVSQGYTKAAAAGIIGNFYVESGMDPTRAQYGGGPGRGLAQWGYNADGGRYNQLIAWAAKNNISPTALGTQLAWTVKEMIARSMDPLMKSTNNVAEATEYFGRIFEAPACLQCSLSLRISYANQAYARNA